MIFYFTGTGNSLSVARSLGEMLGEPLLSIGEELKAGKKDFIYPVKADEKILFVYPVHSWGPAVPVVRFISGLTLSGYGAQTVYSICTCGDECGYTGTMLQAALAKRGLPLTAFYSVVMPNNYILLPGFNVDTQEVEQHKLAEAPVRISQIVKSIKERQNVNLYTIGSLPWLKSKIIYPLFSNFAIGSNSFRATDACISCGLCERVCPTGTIRLIEGKPRWADTCVQCVACIHRCPVRAIEYGKKTVKKGRYHHPELK